MELLTNAASPDDDIIPSASASEHFALGWAHLARGVKMTFGCVKPVPVRLETVPDDVHEAPPKNGVFLPIQPWKELWDLVVLVFILYSAVMVPFRICFDSPALGWWFWAEQLVTGAFLLDVCFNFNTAYMVDDRWVISRPQIALRYLQGWFWIDAPSSVPVELIDLLLEGDNESLGMLRFLRLFRLLRLLRLLKASAAHNEVARSLHALLHGQSPSERRFPSSRLAAGG